MFSDASRTAWGALILRDLHYVSFMLLLMARAKGLRCDRAQNCANARFEGRSVRIDLHRFQGAYV